MAESKISNDVNALNRNLPSGNKKKVLVTGGLGYIGSHVVRQLGEVGYDIIVYDNCSTGSTSALLFGEFVIGDLGCVERLRQVFSQYQFDAVLHLAASTVVPESIKNPLFYYANNARNTLNLLECCQSFGVNQLIFSSTAAVYGEPVEVPVSESAPTSPVNPYGKSKLMSEWMIQDYCQASNLRYVILRYFNVSGADPEGRIGPSFPKTPLLVKIACEAALGRRAAVKIFGIDFPHPDGTGIRDYVHVEDIAAAHIDALHYLQQSGESQILNCGYGRGYSVREVIDQVKTVAGVDFPVIETGRRPGDPACVIANAEKIQEVLGWKPKFNDLRAIVSTALAWERKLMIQPSLPIGHNVASQSFLGLTHS